MLIRKLDQKDLTEITSITKKAWAEYSMWKMLEDRHGSLGNKSWDEKKNAQIIGFCDREPDKVIVAEVDGKIVGYATFKINREDLIGIVSNNAVDPDYQGRGIGTTMIKWILNHFRREKLKVSEVTTLIIDKPAQRVYEKLGFRELTRSVHYSMEL